jgi:hypothetical protein
MSIPDDMLRVILDQQEQGGRFTMRDAKIMTLIVCLLTLAMLTMGCGPKPVGPSPAVQHQHHTAKAIDTSTPSPSPVVYDRPVLVDVDDDEESQSCYPAGDGCNTCCIVPWSQFPVCTTRVCTP